MTQVIKRDKTRQEYSRAKLEKAIDMAARRAKLNEARRRELIREVAQNVHRLVLRRRAIKSTDLRRMVLRRLESRSRAVSASWRRYDRSRR